MVTFILTTCLSLFSVQKGGNENAKRYSLLLYPLIVIVAKLNFMACLDLKNFQFQTLLRTKEI